MNTAEQANRTKPERRLVSFAADMMVLANKAAEEHESLPAGIQEHKNQEADFNRGLDLYKTYKKRNIESGLEQLSFDDSLVLANTTSFALTEQVSKEVETASLKVVKPNRDSSDHACSNDDKFFKKKYVRRKRVGAVLETCNLFKKLCTHKSSTSSLFNMDAAHKEEPFLYKTQSTFEQGESSKATGAAFSQRKQFDRLYARWEQGYVKKKRSQRKRKRKNSGERRKGKEQACDQIHTCDNFGEEAETEEDEKGNASDARNSSNCNRWSGFSFNVQWRNKAP